MLCEIGLFLSCNPTLTYITSLLLFLGYALALLPVHSTCSTVFSKTSNDHFIHTREQISVGTAAATAEGEADKAERAQPSAASLAEDTCVTKMFGGVLSAQLIVSNFNVNIYFFQIPCYLFNSYKKG